jgi:hypothetical protein
MRPILLRLMPRLNRKLLEILVIRNVVINRFSDDLGSLSAVLVGPFRIVFFARGGLFLLKNIGLAVVVVERDG